MRTFLKIYMRANTLFPQTRFYFILESLAYLTRDEVQNFDVSTARAWSLARAANFQHQAAMLSHVQIDPFHISMDLEKMKNKTLKVWDSLQDIASTDEGISEISSAAKTIITRLDKTSLSESYRKFLVESSDLDEPVLQTKARPELLETAWIKLKTKTPSLYTRRVHEALTPFVSKKVTIVRSAV